MKKHRQGRITREGRGAEGTRRTDTGTEVLYGRQPVHEMLLAGRRRVEALYLARTLDPREETHALRVLAEERRVAIRAADVSQLDQMSAGGHHQGVVSVVSPFRYVSYKKLLSDAEQVENPLFLFLDHLEDPQNVGSLLRTAEGCGVNGVVLPEHRAAGVTAAVVRASAGAAEHLPVARVTNLVRCMRLLQERGVWFAGLDGGDDAVPITESRLCGPLGVVIGSEGRGMRRLTRESCDFVVRLPMLGRITSFNAAVAGAMALYEVVRQRSQGQ